MNRIVFLIGMVAINCAVADEADVFFDDTQVQEVRLEFDASDWHETLFRSHSDDPEDPYFPVRFTCNGTTLSPVGVRFKGNSSFRVNSTKKSLKLNFAEYDEDQTFLGLKKLNFNNGFKDPSMLREKLFLDFAGQYLPTLRAVHTRIYINDEFVGLYLAVEQIDKTFVQSRFGKDEDGNLYKAETSSDIRADSGFGSDLTWLGDDPNVYHACYQLKTNETAYDNSQLIEVIDILNNTPADDLPAALEPVFDTESALLSMALNNLFVNLDSYCGSAHNYYLYDRDDTGKIMHLHWDTNEAFGRFLTFLSAGENPLQLDPLWLPESRQAGRSRPGEPQTSTAESRPLMEKLWDVEAYRRTYLCALASMLREGFDTETMSQRIEALADVIRPSLYGDQNKLYSNNDFETNQVRYVDGAYGLLEFVEERSSYLDTALDSYADHSDIRLNEIMITNTQTIEDHAGDCDPWLELYNAGPGRVDLTGMYLSDDLNDATQWALPEIVLDNGAYLVLWLDAETDEEATHVSFIPPQEGGTLYLSAEHARSTSVIDQLTYSALAPDQSFGRASDGAGNWDLMDFPTPGAANAWTYEPPALYINEIMAANETTIEDPDEDGAFEDWIEIYNAEAYDVDLGGMVLTDDPNDLGGYTIPTGVVIPAGGYLLFWADSDSEQGDLHTNFKLDRAGEFVGLYGTEDNGHGLIDSIKFGEQIEDTSYGRDPAGGQWNLLSSPTPGFANM